MAHPTTLITLIVAGIGLSFVFGTIANRLRVSPLIGYLLAGVVVGPFSPGFVADQGLASELAEIGVILLMFGVGLHFSLRELIAVRAIAIPGALLQLLATALLGFGLARLFGWPAGAGVVFGLALSIASTVVLLRTLQEHRLMDTGIGRISVGWLVIQDLLTVVVLVLLPVLSGLLNGHAGPDIAVLARTVAITLSKVAAFVALMLIVGRRVIPAILHYVAHTGSRELFRLAVLAVALCVAFGASELFGVSFALGAFFAGMVLSESQLSQRAAEETLPLRDAFAVLFFMSVGMLFDPLVVVRHPGMLAATFLVILLGNAGGAILLLRAFGQPIGTALTIAVGLAQIGEFSFILADLGIQQDLMPALARDLILGGSIVTILANPLLFALSARLRSWIEHRQRAEQLHVEPLAEEPPMPDIPPTTLSAHAVLVGFGRVGRLVGEELLAENWPVLVIEDGRDVVEATHPAAMEVIVGNAAKAEVLHAANLPQARILLVAIPDAFEAGQIVEQARAINPAIEIIARAHHDTEVAHLTRHGANFVVMGEREIARTMLIYARGHRPEENPTPAGAT
jgi:CPA2 family monovalent cation:H+ antiporter-2